MPRLRRWSRAALASYYDRCRQFRSGGADRANAALTDLADEFAGNERRLRALLAGDGRDAGYIPGFDALADRQREIVEQLCHVCIFR